MERSRRSASALLILLFVIGCAHTKLEEKKPEPLKYEEIQEKINRVYPELILCYHQSLKNKKIFYGRAMLTIKINKTGKIVSIAWKPEPPLDFKECSWNVLKEIKFRRLPDTVRIELPIKFTLEMEEKK